MEPIIGAFFDEEWESLSKLFSTEMHVDHGLFSTNDHHEANGNNFHYFSQESSITSCGSDGMFLSNNPSHEHLQHYSNNIDVDVNNFLQVAINNHPDDQSIDFFGMDNKNLENVHVNPDDTRYLSSQDEMICDHQLVNAGIISPVSSKEMQLKRKFDKVSHQSSAKDQKVKEELPENPKKKSRGSQNAQKNKKKVQPRGKKNQKSITQINNEEGDQEETTNASKQNGQSSSCCSSEDDSNASQELNGGAISSKSKGSALNLSGKSRASRGAATDPQSLYARKRREKINERLRILQNLVPNGTKVDISTMLEEAVNYVKFLQLQIKLLSSDEHWMYAPLAYHGMDIGLYQQMLPNL